MPSLDEFREQITNESLDELYERRRNIEIYSERKRKALEREIEIKEAQQTSEQQEALIDQSADLVKTIKDATRTTVWEFVRKWIWVPLVAVVLAGLIVAAIIRWFFPPS